MVHQHRNEFKKAMIGISAFMQLIGDIYSGDDDGNNDDDDDIDEIKDDSDNNNHNNVNPLQIVYLIEAKLNEMVANTKNKINLQAKNSAEKASLAQDDDMKQGVNNGMTNLTNVASADLKSLCVDLTVNKEELKQMLDKYLPHSHTASDMYYNYFDKDKLRQTLLSRDYVSSEYEMIPEVVNIIVDYCGITNWFHIDKSRNISLIESDDKNISYAILRNDKSQTVYHSIFLNDWIELDLQSTSTITTAKKVFKYIFKCTQLDCSNNCSNLSSSNTYIGTGMDIGFYVKTSKNKKMKFTNVTANEVIGAGKDGNSMACAANSRGRAFSTSGIGINDVRQRISWNDFIVEQRFDNTSKDSYFMVQLDFISNKMSVICGAFENQKKCHQHEIPKAIIKQLQQTDQICVGSSLEMTVAGAFEIVLLRGSII